MERKIYCDYLRIVATFAVVILHVAATNWSNTDVNGMAWHAFNFYNSISRWCVPIFVMISGSLFLGRNIPIKKIYSKYILRMAVAFVVWSLFYGLVNQYTVKHGIVQSFRVHIRAILSGHYHMWFILMIIGLYMCLPFMEKIISDEMIMKYYLILSFIFVSFIPWMFNFINEFVGYKINAVKKLVDIINNNISSMEMSMVLGFPFYFILGFYLDRIKLEKRTRVIIYLLGIVGFAFTVIADSYLTMRVQKPCGTFYGYYNLNVLFEALAVHTLFRYHDSKSELLGRVAIKLSKYAFGVYLVHDYFIDRISFRIGITTLSFDGRVSVPMISLAVIVASFCVSAILNHIPVIKKYCV